MMHYIFSILLLATLLIGKPAHAQSGQWVWLRGDSTLNGAGHYGIKGVADIANEPPAGHARAHWTDLDGNFWQFGSNAGNDLWKYTPQTNTWTWVHGLSGTAGSGVAVYGTLGVPSPLNVPAGVNGPMYWTDAAGDLWLFGGEASTFYLDALWRYHIATNEWTWMAGSPGSVVVGHPPAVYGTQHNPASTNTPGGRGFLGMFKNWSVNNNLWMFGGYAYFGLKNDLWRYDLGTNQWAWESGSQTFNPAGNYGTRGISNASNLPPPRQQAVGWLDADDNLSLFSGGPFTHVLNDLWKYERSSGLWTWSGGTANANDPGAGSAYCDPDPAFLPNSRGISSITASSITCTRAFWLFGSNKMSNDLWLFNAGNQVWTKIKGYSSASPAYSYGTKGVPAASNLPKGRYGAAMWTDASGSLYMSGGGVPDPVNPLFSMRINDLWKFIPDTACYYSALRINEGGQLTPPSDTLLCAGDSVKMVIPINSDITVSPASGRRIDAAAGEITFYGGANTTYTVTSSPGNPCSGFATLSFSIVVPPLPRAAFSIDPDIAYLDNPVFNFINRSTHALRYEWYYNGQLLGTGRDLVHRFAAAGKHCVTLVAINKCGERDSVTQCCEVRDKLVFFVPNAFSPNGDGQNDVFEIQGGNIKVRTFEVFNRYGQRIFNAYNLSGKWDGTFNGGKCDVGTYYYCIRYADTQSGEEHTIKGDVLLLR